MKFVKEQRVIVPGSEAQAVVVDAVESVPGFPVYTLRWLDEAGETHTGSCGEGDLHDCNLSTAERDQIEGNARDKQMQLEEQMEIEIGRRVKDRLAWLSARKRKANRKRRR